MTNFSIGDLLIRIKNSSSVLKKTVAVPKFKFGISVLEVLKKHKYVVDFVINEKDVEVTLGYDGEQPKFQDVKLFSTPGRRWYLKVSEITPVRSGTGIMIVSTPSGVMTSSEAKKAKIGGELICEVW